ncbi:hypothetical protein FACS189443_2700 [Planctomycetales bacterium]|nr:hypothetical protein FACS189443_2700 [Planctomycetales bacterium]
MSVFDIIVFTILIALTLRGIWLGMISQIVSVGSYFVCWIVASRFAFLIAPSIPAEEPWNQVGAMAVLFIITLIAIRFFRAVLETFVKRLHLESLNKLLGGALGFLKAALICMVLTFFAVTLSETTQNIVFESKSGQTLVNLITQSSAFVPKDSCEMLREQLNKFSNKIANRDPTASRLNVQQAAVSEKKESNLSANSFFSAVQNWWSGTKKATTESIKDAIEQKLTEELSATTQRVQNSIQDTVQDFVQSVVPQPPQPKTANTQTEIFPIVPKASVVDDLFSKKLEPLQSTATNQSAANTGGSLLQPLSATQTAEPTVIALPDTQLAPLPVVQHRISSDQLLYNSSQSTIGNTPAARYRSQ